MYLTASRPDIMFVVCACARFQVTPKVSHLHVVKRIFRYLKGQPKLGLWYPKDSPFNLEAYTDSDYAGAIATYTTEAEYIAAASCCGQQLMVKFQVSTVGLTYYWYSLTKNPIIYVSLIEKFCQTATVRTIDNGEQEIIATVDGKEFTITEASIRRHLQLADVDGIRVTEFPQTSEPIPNVPNEAVYEEWDDRVERAITNAASLNAKQASGGSPRCQEAMGGSITQTRSERVPTESYDSPLLRVHTVGSDKGSMTLQELMVLYTTLSKKVESLEADLKQTKKVYAAAYTKLIKKVKNLEKTIKSNQARRRAKIMVSDDDEDFEDSSKQGRMIEEIDQDAGVTLVTRTNSQEDQPEDQLGVFSAAKVLADASKENVHTYTRRRRTVSTGSGGISTTSRLFSTAEESISTAGASMLVSTTGMVQEVNISIPSPVVVKDKGKGKMKESKDE
ncbi:hypothetical protein Tco_0778266 [Tanacetum coccineum]